MGCEWPLGQAEDGFLGIICARKASALTEGAAAETSKNIGGGYAPDSPWWRDLSLSPQEWREIDSEGRCLVLDFQRFVLFNVYAPHESGVERRSFKMKFYRGLEARVRSLLDLDREVVLVGDLNVCRTPLDHCDPERSIRENELTEFGEHPARQWIHEFLTPGGPMVDLYRHFHPTQKGAFTCWNTLIDARCGDYWANDRRGNYGTRIDYIIVSPGLLPSLKECNVDQAVMGSDHCPVSARFHERIRVEGGQDLDLLGSLLEKSFECKNPPPLCCAHYDELSGKQQTIRKFLEQKASAAFTPFSEARKVVPSFLARPAAAQHSKKKAPRKAPGGGIAAHQKAITSFFASVVSTGDVTNLPGSGSPCNSTLHAQPLLSDAQPTPVDLTPTRSAAALLGYDQPEPAAGADSRPAAGTESPPKSAADESTDASISAEGSQSCSAATSQALHFAAGCPDFSIEEAVPVSTTASSTASKSAWESIFKPPEVLKDFSQKITDASCIDFRPGAVVPTQGTVHQVPCKQEGPKPGEVFLYVRE
ncbi:MAG: Endonuclease/exonuclease/phosphatase, partial [Olpidium bornovanus]